MPAVSSSSSLSVVIPTTRGYASLASCLHALLPQATANDGIILVIDGSGEAVPSDLPQEVRWIAAPGEGVFALRRRGMQLADTPLVALTEDHCVPAADWWQAILCAHREQPQARAIAGRAINGSTRTACERAAFLMTLLPSIAPLDKGYTAGHLSISGASFRRHEGWDLDLAGVPRLSRADVASDPRVLVTHVQPGGWRDLAALQFHNARAVSGDRGLGTSRDWLRLMAAWLMPWPRIARQLTACVRKGLRLHDLVVCVPAFVWLFHAKGVGEIAGYLFGPGISARHLQ